jgi:hypothetical protein
MGPDGTSKQILTVLVKASSNLPDPTFVKSYTDVGEGDGFQNVRYQLHVDTTGSPRKLNYIYIYIYIFAKQLAREAPIQR